MSTRKLPFYEKDALRWRDTLAHMRYELVDIQRCCNLASVSHRIGDQIQQVSILCEDIQHKIDQRRVKK